MIMARVVVAMIMTGVVVPRMVVAMSVTGVAVPRVVVARGFEDPADPGDRQSQDQHRGHRDSIMPMKLKLGKHVARRDAEERPGTEGERQRGVRPGRLQGVAARACHEQYNAEQPALHPALEHTSRPVTVRTRGNHSVRLRAWLWWGGHSLTYRR